MRTDEDGCKRDVRTQQYAAVEHSEGQRGTRQGGTPVVKRLHPMVVELRAHSSDKTLDSG